jgi:YVTN family beta-propeller protein
MARARIHPVRPLVLVALGSLALTPLLTAAEIAKSQPGTPQSVARLRHPVALALAEHGTLLLVANQRSGTVSVIDLKTRRVAAEVPIGKTLTDLVAVPGKAKDEFLVTDEATHKLHLIRQRGSELTVAESLLVSPFPVNVRCDAAGKRCFVASLWSHKVTIVDLDRSPDGSLHLKTADVMPLSFAPRLEIVSPDGANLIVADAFGGQLAVIDVAARRFVAAKTLPAHNIRGLAWSADGRQLVVSHQTLSPLAYTDAADAHWGSIVSNVLRSLDRDALENPNKDILANSQLFQLGDVGNGAADPASVVVTNDGTVYVALAGVGEVAAGRLAPGPFPRHDTDFHRLPVGVRPTALATSGDGSQLYVADTFGNAISVIKWNEYHSIIGDPVRVSLGPEPPLSLADRGERLFFDARLSHDHWMSCHSCHTDGHSSDQLSDTLGDGSFGAPKRIPPLGGVADTGPWAWNGSMPDLAGQVQKSVQTTMHGKTISAEQVRDLTAYLKTLPPAPPLDVPSDAAAKAAVERGRVLFMRHGCNHCHSPPTYTSSKTFDVGLQDELGNRRFNPPSLRGVGQRSAFFHDGRAEMLGTVFGKFHHPGKTSLSAREDADLLAFLRSL